MKTLLLTEADKYFREKKYEKAVEAYNAIVNQHFDDAKIHEKLAKCFFELGRFKDAQLECETAIKIDNKLATAYYLLGLIFEKEEKLDEAEKSLRNSLVFNPDSAETYNSLGIILSKRNKFEDSLLAYNRATQLDNSSWKAHFNMATILRAQNNFPDSLKESLKALRINPSVQTIYWTVVSIELAYPKYFGIVNMALLFVLLVFRSAYLIPIAFLFSFMILLRASIWFRFGFRFKSAITILLGVSIIFWYFYRIILK